MQCWEASGLLETWNYRSRGDRYQAICFSIIGFARASIEWKVILFKKWEEVHEKEEEIRHCKISSEWF